MKTVKRFVAIMLSLSVLAGMTGCAKEQPSSVSVSASEPVTESVSEKVEAPALSKLTDDNGQPIADFDEFVNGAWRAEQNSNGTNLSYPQDEMRNTILVRVQDILENTDTGTLSPDDGLYKAITFYGQIIDSENIEKRTESVKKYLSRIDKIKNLNDLYALYRDERYMALNSLLSFYVDSTDGGRYILFFRTTSLSAPYDSLLSALESGEIPEGADILVKLGELGYSHDRIREILENARKVDGYIAEYYNSPDNDGTLINFNHKRMENRDVTMPILNILSDMGIIGEDDGVLALNAFDQFLNTLFMEENAAAIRDYHILSSVLTLSVVSDYVKNDNVSESRYRETAARLVMFFANDVIAEEYTKRFIKDSTVEEVSAAVEELKKTASDVVYNAEWLSTHGKELARRKILRLRDSIGKNEAAYDLHDVVITDDVVENYISVMVGNQLFRYSQLNKEDDERKIFSQDMLDVNARNLHAINGLYLCAGLLSEYEETAGDSYEEKLAHIGRVIAHEISHSYDPMRIRYDSNGWYEPWLTEEEQAEYDNEAAAIVAFFDGKEDEYGRKISGGVILNETYSDILGVKICLKLLSEKENVDYDKFFRAYAKYQTMYYTENGIGIPPENGYLPGKMRVNFVLGQFDKFYETYDIDENSAFFVPEDQRIDIFKDR